MPIHTQSFVTFRDIGMLIWCYMNSVICTHIFLHWFYVCIFKTFQSRIKKKSAVDLHEYQLDSPIQWNVALLSTASGIFLFNLTCTQSAFNNTAWSLKRFGVTHSQQGGKKNQKPPGILRMCVESNNLHLIYILY